MAEMVSEIVRRLGEDRPKPAPGSAGIDGIGGATVHATLLSVIVLLVAIDERSHDNSGTGPVLQKLAAMNAERFSDPASGQPSSKSQAKADALVLALLGQRRSQAIAMIVREAGIGITQVDQPLRVAASVVSAWVCDGAEGTPSREDLVLVGARLDPLWADEAWQPLVTAAEQVVAPLDQGARILDTRDPQQPRNLAMAHQLSPRERLGEIVRAATDRRLSPAPVFVTLMALGLAVAAFTVFDVDGSEVVSTEASLQATPTPTSTTAANVAPSAATQDRSSGETGEVGSENVAQFGTPGADDVDRPPAAPTETSESGETTTTLEETSTTLEEPTTTLEEPTTTEDPTTTVAETTTSTPEEPTTTVELTTTVPPTTETTPPRRAAISLTKSIDSRNANGSPGPKFDKGTTVTLTYRVENSGTVKLSNISVTDDSLGAVSCPATVLAPGGSFTCSATTKLRTTGPMSLSAVASGTRPGGATVSANDAVNFRVVPRT